MQRMRPMSEAPPVGTAVMLWWKEVTLNPAVVIWHDGWLERAPSFAGWTPIVRPLEPEAPEQTQKPRCKVCGDTRIMERRGHLVPCTHCHLPREIAPEPVAQTMPPTPQRLRLQMQSAAHESVALRQPLAAFQALAGVAHAQATQRAARVGR